MWLKSINKSAGDVYMKLSKVKSGGDEHLSSNVTWAKKIPKIGNMLGSKLVPRHMS